MHFTSLLLSGFKTFADKTEIRLGPGLTAVVGPNGCGKSNIGDALLWVMGEQNPRHLRGTDARDVIFSGSERRKPYGMAEVRLTVDNSDRSLPTEFAEVAITRRIYRSGESQYLLNGAPCRMKDIVELFLDSGVGKSAYSFVGQSEIDAVLSSRPEDRRELLEEAAGIKKYRVKKREAVRKLDSAETNLQRVRDIIAELDSQQAPLSRQAEQAKRFRELQTRLGQIEVDLLVGEVQQLDYELYAHRQNRATDSEAIAALDAEIDRLDFEGLEISELSSNADRSLEAARTAHQASLTAKERVENRLQLLREREHSSETNAATLAQEISTLTSQIDEQQRAEKRISHRITVLLATEEKSKAAVKEVEFEWNQITERLKAADRSVDEAAEAERALQSRSARLEAASAGLDARESALASRLNEWSSSLKECGDELADRQLELKASHVLVAKLKAEAEQVSQTIQEQDSLLKQTIDRRELARTEREALSREIASAQSRKQALMDLQASGDGYYQGVRAVLQAKQQGHLTADYVPVADVLTVEEAHRIAIEVALGSSAQDVICQTESDARLAINYLKRERAGRATFLPIDFLSPSPAYTPKKSLFGLLGVATDFVRCDLSYGPVLLHLLGRVLVAETVEDAVEASRTLSSGWSRIVTLEGEVVTTSGAMTGGSLAGKGAHLLGRKAEIDSLTDRIAGLERDYETMTQRLAQFTSEFEAITVNVAQQRSLSNDINARLAAQTQAEKALSAECSSLSERIQSATDALERAHESLAAFATERETLTLEWAALTEERAKLSEVGEVSPEDRDRLRRDRDALGQRMSQVRVEFARSVEQTAAARREAVVAQNRLKELIAASAERIHRKDAGNQGLAATLEEIRKLEIDRAELLTQLTITETAYSEARTKRQELQVRVSALSSAVRQQSQERDRRRQELHETDLQIARLEVKYTQTSERLEQEYGLTAEEAIARPTVENIDKSTVGEVSRLRRELKSMGEVNLGAIDELDRIQERFTFLTRQQEDLEMGRRSLLSTIDEIDASTREAFMSTFNAVADHFDRLFHRLFGGGTTRLSLTLPEDLLETGIEVVAQPPGKRPQHLSLLSGGERALTAVALLFSLMSVKPGPFVVLDEVDAPLDGANVEKFVSLVEEFSQEAQFLVITHNPVTMEAAPRWYGVTMREPGVSSVISYRVPEETERSAPDLPLNTNGQQTSAPQ